MWSGKGAAASGRGPDIAGQNSIAFLCRSLLIQESSIGLAKTWAWLDAGAKFREGFPPVRHQPFKTSPRILAP